ncbi:MAG: glycosyltransferase [Butyrivibrio sp.]|uniref:glycosyltransferase n=1 Tax=Butyrivibrio sp. TaxID=28121 RepID=UPI0025FCFB42|nr:glycosyltransferase [Butyrivibrio sp.]MCR5770692.1 glycosyltransferase [Butyrivibrio sp.]
MNYKLSICIPSYNRGNLAEKLVNNLLRVFKNKKYIEIVISNNGSVSNTEGYKALKNKNNDNLLYKEFEENKGFEENLRTVVSYARSNLCLILSDEDELIPENIDYYINFFDEHPSLAVMYSKVESHPTYSVNEKLYWKKGYEAAHCFYVDAYISGIIFNKLIVTDELLTNIYSKCKTYYTYRYVPQLFWIGEAILRGDFAYNPMIDLIRVGKNILERDLDCKNLGNGFSVSQVMLPESYINNSHEVINFIYERETNIDVKLLMFQQYLKYAFLSIDWLDIAAKASGTVLKDRIPILTKIKESLESGISAIVNNAIDRNIYIDVIKFQYNYVRFIYNRDSYIDTLTHMPPVNRLKALFEQKGIASIAIYGVGGNAESTAVLIYRLIKNLVSVILVDRDAGRFDIDASNPGRFQQTDQDFYELTVNPPSELSKNTDLIIVVCAGYIEEIKEYLKAFTSAPILSIVDLYDMCNGTFNCNN